MRAGRPGSGGRNRPATISSTAALAAARIVTLNDTPLPDATAPGNLPLH